MNKTITEVEQMFRDQIEVPHVKPPQQLFFCTVGLVGAGKTTVTKPISRKLNLVRISSDEIRELLKNNGFTYDAVNEIYFKVAMDYINQGYGIAFDRDCGNAEAKQRLESIAERAGAKIIWVHIDTPEEFIFEKFRNHPPTWLADNPQTMIDNYHAQKQKRMEENTHFDFLYTFDTSKENIKEQIEECLGLIKTTFLS